MNRRRERRREPEEPENHERWLISYADFITLLFAFFVVMYALSSINEGKYKMLSNSLINAFGSAPAGAVPRGDGQPKEAPGPLPAHRPRTGEISRQEREKMNNVARDILQVLAPLVKQGKVKITQTVRGVSVDINASVLFAPGDATLSGESSQALKAVAAVLKADDHAIQVEGHTDSTPIRNASFPSNWELSSVRASSVVRLMEENGIAQPRLTAVGYGPTRPVSTNDTAEGRLSNRRVSITIMSNIPGNGAEVPVDLVEWK
ncbi:flagellar motor protein MotD [Noviherbaspirillum galbum]|uniref:Flagellar motor protein MotD n=1 Tax=Noviherbaspirillum galbum TaxID=2709383 RepID=A0A6B3SPV3_9BURK|nr:flagellar motor protein MotD [Noviherbaspirillum galbum]NEX62671.1 flagellar motor protein MotD [Noviherbaspirillum galbum]